MGIRYLLLVHPNLGQYPLVQPMALVGCTARRPRKTMTPSVPGVPYAPCLTLSPNSAASPAVDCLPLTFLVEIGHLPPPPPMCSVPNLISSPGHLNLVKIPLGEDHGRPSNANPLPRFSAGSSNHRSVWLSPQANKAPSGTVLRLQACRLELATWSKHSLGSIDKRIKSIETERAATHAGELTAAVKQHRGGLQNELDGLLRTLISRNCYYRMEVTWNLELINAIFCVVDAQVITALPVPVSTEQDRLVLHFSKTEAFSVQSAYNVAVEMETRGHTVGGFSTLLMKLSFHATPRIRVPKQVECASWTSIPEGCFNVYYA
ncbi:hypothetical protein Salat_1883200 [Sesamum alatum]|uniref:Uncharacterized protein n=1 Tax=Sesamum alatum TaxID=300844 RepID=A0AAE2CI32_9LAMI|nr:hypothetical protein Salat_1883200 [Sesamum alatum]